MDYDKYLKKDLTTILILFVIVVIIFTLIYFLGQKTGYLDVLASQVYDFFVN